MDPIDQQILDDPTNQQQQQQAITQTTDDADAITMSRAEIEKLRRDAEQGVRATEELAGLKPEIERLATALKQQPQQQHNQQQNKRSPSSFNDSFWQDPGATAATIAQETVREMVTPATEIVAKQLASIGIGQFKMNKMQDPTFTSIAPLFDQKVNSLNLVWLGSLDPSAMTGSLTEIWNSAVGQWYETERQKRVAARPVNLGGGGNNGGGGGGKAAEKTLKELDPIAYKMAVEGGLSEEDMKELAKEIESEQ